MAAQGQKGDVLDPTNATINAALLKMREQLRDALHSGNFGEWRASLPVKDGLPGRLKTVFEPSFDLTSLAKVVN